LPLLSRKEDILELVQHFMDLFSKDMGIVKPALSEKSEEFLYNYAWPGNVRELKNVVQRLLFVDSNVIGVDDVKNSVYSIPAPSNKTGKVFNFNLLSDLKPLRELEKSFRQEYFEYIREHSLSDAEAAKKLGLAPPNFYRMSKELGLK
jgi:DNA-binding NtrC family response regulator